MSTGFDIAGLNKSCQDFFRNVTLYRNANNFRKKSNVPQ